MLQDRVTLVTAGGSGIGRAGAVAMARQGAFVVVSDLHKDLATETLEQIRASGGKGEARALDMRDDAAVMAEIARVATAHGRIDVLHSHAGIQIMRAQGGGSVIITASNSGCQYDRGMVSYATTKHAAVAMVKQMAADYAREKIRFNALCPGFVDTPFNAGFEAQMGGRARLESYVTDTIPMGRWASAEEIAEGIVYLASDRSAFVTGLALVIDGGESL
jgi:NAD(P)-dependent dehydrogenase (short-subunit alcohol dehydrogenase family)